MKEPCLQLKKDYDLALKLLGLFNANFEEAVAKREFRKIKQVKKALEAVLRGIWERFYCSPEKAKEILGEDYLGPEAVLHAFGVDLKPEQIPRIPFKEWEIEKAKEMEQFLVLRIDKTRTGKPLTIKNIEEECGFPMASHRVVYNKSNITNRETPRVGWALVSKQSIPGSLNKNYLQQTEVLVNYLSYQYHRYAMPQKLREIIFETGQSIIRIRSELSQANHNKIAWNKVAKELTNLEINRLFRPKSVEVVYDMEIYHSNTTKSLIPKEQVWTWEFLERYNRVSSVGGQEKLMGYEVDAGLPYLGLMFSRRE